MEHLQPLLDVIQLNICPRQNLSSDYAIGGSAYQDLIRVYDTS